MHCGNSMHGTTADALTRHTQACKDLHACLQGGAQEGPDLGQGLPEPIDTGQAGTAGPGKGFVSPLRLDRLAMFHDIVTSPEASPITHREHCQSGRLTLRLAWWSCDAVYHAMVQLLQLSLCHLYRHKPLRGLKLPIIARMSSTHYVRELCRAGKVPARFQQGQYTGCAVQGRARLGELLSPGGQSYGPWKKPRLELDIEEMVRPTSPTCTVELGSNISMLQSSCLMVSQRCALHMRKQAYSRRSEVEDVLNAGFGGSGEGGFIHEG